MSWTFEDCGAAGRALVSAHALGSPAGLLARPQLAPFRLGDATFMVRHGSRQGGLLRGLRGLPAPGRGLFEQLLALDARGLRCARPALFAQQQIAGIPCRWVLLVQVPHGAETLARFIRTRIGPTLPGRRERRRLLEELGQLLRAVRHAGWANPGLDPQAILVEGWPGAFHFVFLGSPLAHTVSGKAELQGELMLALARLSRGRFSTQEVLRFLRVCNDDDSLRETQRRLSRRVLRALR